VESSHRSHFICLMSSTQLQSAPNAHGVPSSADSSSSSSTRPQSIPNAPGVPSSADSSSSSSPPLPGVASATAEAIQCALDRHEGSTLRTVTVNDVWPSPTKKAMTSVLVNLHTSPSKIKHSTAETAAIMESVDVYWILNKIQGDEVALEAFRGLLSPSKGGDVKVHDFDIATSEGNQTPDDSFVPPNLSAEVRAMGQTATVAQGAYRRFMTDPRGLWGLGNGDMPWSWIKSLNGGRTVKKICNILYRDYGMTEEVAMKALANKWGNMARGRNPLRTRTARAFRRKPKSQREESSSSDGVCCVGCVC
jgi:hypothetical protein